MYCEFCNSGIEYGEPYYDLDNGSYCCDRCYTELEIPYENYENHGIGILECYKCGQKCHNRLFMYENNGKIYCEDCFDNEFWHSEREMPEEYDEGDYFCDYDLWTSEKGA